MKEFLKDLMRDVTLVIIVLMIVIAVFTTIAAIAYKFNLMEMIF